MSSDNLEFEQPDWRGDVHQQEEVPTGIMLNDALIEILQPLDELLDGEVFVTGAMVLQAVKNLAEKHGNIGPFSDEQVTEATNEIVMQEVNLACDGLVAKGLAEYDENGDIRFLE